MRLFIIIISIFSFSFCYSQDTIRYSDYSKDTIRYDNIVLIFKDNFISQRIFYKKNKVDIRIVYIYDEKGLLIRRVWYNSKGKIMGIVID